MNKVEMARELAKKLNKSNKDMEEYIDAFIETVTETLIAGDEVRLSGFGTFEVSKREARMGRNPKTGEPCMVAAYKSPKFKPLPALKRLINGDGE